ncbi:MAG: hypothetical protein RJB24_610 [Candidatus Parcubacteria bacterium]|jgi:hypothetical protein
MKDLHQINIYKLLSVLAVLFLSLPLQTNANTVGFPNGILLKATNNPKVYYIENGTKRPIESPNMLRSQFRWEDLVVSTPVEVDALPMGPDMTYRDGSLLSNRGVVYVISDGTRRPIESPSSFLQKGYKWSNVIPVSDAELAPHTQGAMLTTADRHPNGSLLLRPGGEVYTIKNGQRRYIPSPLIFEARYRWESLIPVSEDYLNTYPRGENEFYPDGLLISSSTGVYMMQNNVRQPITSPEVFESYGLNWGQVRRATDFELSIIPVSGAFNAVKTYREGSLIGAQSGAVYRVDNNGVLQYISSPNIFSSQGYSWDTIVRFPDRVVNQYTRSGRVGFGNGALISYGGGVFFIENGLKRGVPSPAIFNARGFRWSDVRTVSEDEFNTNPMGEPLSDIQAASIQGYAIPATSGKTAREQHLPLSCSDTDENNAHYLNANTPVGSARNGVLTTGGAFAIGCPSGSRNSSYAPFSVEEEKYYITMRWNYVRWYEATSTLTQNISATSDRIPLTSVADYPNTGWVIVNGEIIAFNGKDGNSLIVSRVKDDKGNDILQRGVDSPSVAASPRAHNSGSTVQEVYIFRASTETRANIWRGRTRTALLSNTNEAKNWHRGKKVLVTNPANGRRLVASIMESGPAIFTNRVSGLSPEAMLALGVETDGNLEYGFMLDQSVPVGPLQ